MQKCEGNELKMVDAWIKKNVQYMNGQWDVGDDKKHLSMNINAK